MRVKLFPTGNQLTDLYPIQAYAVGLKGVSCTEDTYANGMAILHNPLVNEGQTTIAGQPWWGILDGMDVTKEDMVTKVIFGRCKQLLSDESLQFVLFVLAIGFLALGYLRLRKGSGGPTSSTV